MEDLRKINLWFKPMAFMLISDNMQDASFCKHLLSSAHEHLAGTLRSIAETALESVYICLAFAVIEYPLVMKSPPLCFWFPSDLVNSDLIFSFSPRSRLRFFFASSSSRTLAVRLAVAASIIPSDILGVDVLDSGVEGRSNDLVVTGPVR